MFVIVSKSGSTIEIQKILDYIITKYALDEDSFKETVHFRYIKQN